MAYLTDIIIAVIAFAGTLIGSMAANSKGQAVLEERVSGIKEDISTLSERVDKHNNLIERMAIVERDSKSHQHQIDEIREEIKDNEKI